MKFHKFGRLVAGRRLRRTVGSMATNARFRCLELADRVEALQQAFASGDECEIDERRTFVFMRVAERSS